jgi:hypothetical protein
VGVVEEVTLPLDQHRLRRGLPAEMLVAEGSHWLLLAKGAATGKRLHSLRFEGYADLEQYLKTHWSAGDRFYRMPHSAAAPVAGLAQRLLQARPEDRGIHDCQQAAWVAEFLAEEVPGSMFLVGGGPRYDLLHFSP